MRVNENTGHDNENDAISSKVMVLLHHYTLIILLGYKYSGGKSPKQKCQLCSRQTITTNNRKIKLKDSKFTLESFKTCRKIKC